MAFRFRKNRKPRMGMEKTIIILNIIAGCLAVFLIGLKLLQSISYLRVYGKLMTYENAIIQKYYDGKLTLETKEKNIYEVGMDENTKFILNQYETGDTSGSMTSTIIPFVGFESLLTPERKINIKFQKKSGNGYIALVISTEVSTPTRTPENSDSKPIEQFPKSRIPYRLDP